MGRPGPKVLVSHPMALGVLGGRVGWGADGGGGGGGERASKEADRGGVNDLTNIFYSLFRSSHSKLNLSHDWEGPPRISNEPT